MFTRKRVSEKKIEKCSRFTENIFLFLRKCPREFTVTKSDKINARLFVLIASTK